MAARRRRIWPWIVGVPLVALGILIALLWTPDMPVAEARSKYANAESEFVQLEPGLTVHLRDEGKADGPVLMLLHGSNASLHTWEPWVARLKDRYRIISVDLPGHGLTGPSPRRDYTAASSVAVVDAVATQRGLGRFTLGGNSMGGGIAMHYALTHPAKLSGLILVDAGGAPSKRTGSLPIGFRIARTPVIRDLMESITPRSLVEKSLRQSVSIQSIVTPEAVDRYWELLRYPGNRRATIDRFSTAYTGLNKARFDGFAVPTLIMWGREDKLIPVTAAEWYAATITGSRSVIYDGIGHIPMEEAPDRSAADVAAFIDGLPN